EVRERRRRACVAPLLHRRTEGGSATGAASISRAAPRRRRRISDGAEVPRDPAPFFLTDGYEGRDGFTRRPRDGGVARMELTRREVLGASAAGVLAACVPAGWAGGVYASDAPEHPKMRIGIIALTDCSSIVMAHELGLFKKYGIDSTISKEAS